MTRVSAKEVKVLQVYAACASSYQDLKHRTAFAELKPQNLLP